MLLHFFVHCVNKDDDQWWGKPARKRYSWEGKYWYIHWHKFCWWSCLKHHIIGHAGTQFNWGPYIFVKKWCTLCYRGKQIHSNTVWENQEKGAFRDSPREPGWPIQEKQELCQRHPLQKNTFAIYVSMNVPVFTHPGITFPCGFALSLIIILYMQGLCASSVESLEMRSFLFYFFH